MYKEGLKQAYTNVDCQNNIKIKNNTLSKQSDLFLKLVSEVLPNSTSIAPISREGPSSEEGGGDE